MIIFPENSNKQYNCSLTRCLSLGRERIVYERSLKSLKTLGQTTIKTQKTESEQQK